MGRYDDDELPPLGQPRAPRFSGFGDDEDERTGRVTPPSGLPAALARSDTAVLLERIGACETKIDGLINDLRSNTKSTRDDRAKLDGIRRELRVLRHRIENIVKTAATKGDLAELQGVIVGLEGGKIANIEKRVRAVQDAIGQPPGSIDLARASLAAQLTAEELTTLEREGTGFYAILARVLDGQKRLVAQAGVLTVVGASVPNVIAQLLEAGHADWVALGVAATAGIGMITAGVRRFVRRRKS